MANPTAHASLPIERGSRSMPLTHAFYTTLAWTLPGSMYSCQCPTLPSSSERHGFGHWESPSALGSSTLKRIALLNKEEACAAPKISKLTQRESQKARVLGEELPTPWIGQSLHHLIEPACTKSNFHICTQLSTAEAMAVDAGPPRHQPLRAPQPAWWRWRHPPQRRHKRSVRR